MTSDGASVSGPEAARQTAPPGRLRLGPWLSVLGLLVLAYVLGAAVMFFEWPSSGFLRKAFIGGRAVSERPSGGQPPAATRPTRAPTESIDRPGKTFDGFTLYCVTAEPTSRSEVVLVDMRRQVLHRWVVSYRKIVSDPSRPRNVFSSSLICVFDCHLYPNGDLLAVVQGRDQLTSGFGLVKLDRDSKVLWTYAGNVHHDVDVAEDGTIYAIAHRSVEDRPKGLESIPPPWQVDDLVLLSPDGKEVRKPIPLLEALYRSPYAPLLTPLEKPRTASAGEASTLHGFDDLRKAQDVLHANSVKVLSRTMAPHFPGLEAGQILLSLRTLDALAVLDPATQSVVWAARGPWRAQHDAQFLASGRLLLFDNLGSPAGSRVLEYDPRTGAFPWTYPGPGGPAFFTSERGMCQRLPNGNTLIVNSEGGELIEVTPGKEVVWTCALPGFVTTARRYRPEQLSFLKGGPRARP
jgi:hypothetical protein